MKRVVVTGASGYIGGRLTAALAREGIDVVATALPGSEAGIPRLAGVIPLPLAIDEREALASAARGADVLFHLAGVLPGAPADALRSVNVDGTAHVARAAAAAGVPRLVFLSSTAVYAPSPRLWPLGEEAPLLAPQRLGATGYGESKSAAEETLRAVPPRRPSVTVVRASTIYGPGSRTVAWLRDRLERPLTSFAAAGRMPAMQWVFADDVVAALIEAGLRPAAAGMTLNVVGGELFSELALLATARAAALGAPSPPLAAGLRFSYAAAAAVLDYRPTPLYDGLRRSLRR